MTAWRHGTGSGDWSRLHAMLDPDVTFHVPIAEFPGLQRGRDAASRFFDHVSSIIRADMEVLSTLVADDRIAFEVRVRGTNQGQPFLQGLCIVFTVDDDRIQAFSEYLAWPGGLDPQHATGVA
jgi:ketosteroid isomerase-like protein